MQNNNVYKDLSRISELRTSPSTDALSLRQERYYDKPRADMHTNLNRQDTVPIRLRTQTDKPHADTPINPIRSRANILRTNPTIASFKKRIASFEKSSNVKIKSFANSNNKTKNAGVKSKVSSSFYRGKGRGKTKEA